MVLHQANESQVAKILKKQKKTKSTLVPIDRYQRKNVWENFFIKKFESLGLTQNDNKIKLCKRIC